MLGNFLLEFLTIDSKLTNLTLHLGIWGMRRKWNGLTINNWMRFKLQIEFCQKTNSLDLQTELSIVVTMTIWQCDFDIKTTSSIQHATRTAHTHHSARSMCCRQHSTLISTNRRVISCAKCTKYKKRSSQHFLFICTQCTPTEAHTQAYTLQHYTHSKSIECCA